MRGPVGIWIRDTQGNTHRSRAKQTHGGGHRCGGREDGTGRMHGTRAEGGGRTTINWDKRNIRTPITAPHASGAGE